jgi:uncharacterized protein YdeI (YjbR/CyaY-like superfamily)
MEMTRTTSAANRQEWRAWLEQNHARETEVWLIYYKKGSDKASITYPESLEEALCFGWVDSLIQKIDEEKYARKFNPRRPGSHWSEVNKHLAASLVRAGRMTATGLAAITFDLPPEGAPRPKRPELALPDWLKTGLMESPLAWQNFNRLPPSHRRNYIGWISEAKQEATRQKRIREVIVRLEKNERLGI